MTRTWTFALHPKYDEIVPKPDRYWKYVIDNKDDVRGIYRFLRSTLVLEAFVGGRWIRAHEMYERVTQEPDFIEITKSECARLVANSTTAV